MAKKKKKGFKFTITHAQIIIFIVIGFALGGALSYVYINSLVRQYLKAMVAYINEDWEKSLYYANRTTDQVIKLKKMMTIDKVKFSRAMMDEAIDTRARLIGADSIDEKVDVLNELEKDLNKIVVWYNGNLKLKNKKFSYIEWGMITAQYLEEYELKKNAFRNTVKEYNDRIKEIPFKGIAKRNGYKKMPLAGESEIGKVSVETEEYTKENEIRKYPFR